MLSGRRRLFHHILHSWGATPAIIATHHPAEKIRQLHTRLGELPDKPSEGDSSRDATADRSTDATDQPLVIDSTTITSDQPPGASPQTRYAQGPGNLTSIGTAFTQIVEDHTTDSLAVGIDSISPLLQYASGQAVYRFVHLIVQQAVGVGWPVAATIDSKAHDEIDIERFVPIFDAVLETRLTDAGEQEFRVRGPTRSEWQLI